MRLADLATLFPGARPINPADPDISLVVYDSRSAQAGSIFVAIPGLAADGHRFLPQAISAGVAAVAVQADREASWSATVADAGVPTLVLPDTRSGLAIIAAALNDFPARRLGVIGITGTDGKTSLSHLVDHVLSQTGRRAGLVTTAECRIGDQPLIDTGRFTTPESPELQGMLAAMVRADCRWAVLEATSHGLAQHRLDSCDFDIAAVTTIGSDHLDFHGSREAYVQAKGRLFEMLGEAQNKGIEKTAVLNADEPDYAYLRQISPNKVISYGLKSGADLRASEVTTLGWRSHFTVSWHDRTVAAEVHGPGSFSVQNALAATGVSLAAGLDLEEAARSVRSWQGAPGRMQLIDEGQPFNVVVDFAHAPDSLKRVLEVLRASSRGRIIALFGCIGEREKDRRFAMGQVAAQHADFTVVTDDNPYTEDSNVIIEEIVAGLEASGKRKGHDFAVIPDRREAISHALSMAVDEDVVLLAGKGHETQVHLPDSVYDCDDREVARRVLAELSTHSRAT
jgi:UDP-N-acetylmuramoyl-L-alanyl-D-glutamate--2,6-diaminopimelate ligase